MYTCGSTGSQLAAGSPGLTAPSFIPATRGMGLFDSGLFNPSGWGITEWAIVGGGLFLALGGMKMLKGRGGASSSNRRRLALLKAKYDLARLS